MVVSVLLAAPAVVASGKAFADPLRSHKTVEQSRRTIHASAHSAPNRSRRAVAHAHPTTPVRSTAFIDDKPFDIHAGWDDSVGWPQAPAFSNAIYQTGVASWYGGSRWQGHRTASGVRYEQDGLTAAHASLPIGTKVRVTLVNSARSVVVTINDRPGTRTRIIDLSRGAARELGILDRGIARVTLTPLAG
jgi:rare lipoprotein A (peptidoglycan hydrolase)